MATPAQFEAILLAAARALSNTREIGLPVAKAMEAETRRRIFNDGQAADGEPIGDYSPKYAKVRLAKGRQTGYVDAQFTGALFDSFHTTTDGKGFIVEARGALSSAKMENIERIFEKAIFAAGKREEDTGKEALIAELDFLFQGLK